MLYGIRAATTSDVSFTWVDAEFLAKHEVAPWGEMTVWIPPVDEYAGFSRVDCSRAIKAGLGSDHPHCSDYKQIAKDIKKYGAGKDGYPAYPHHVSA